jgi:phage shock protein A
MLEDIQKNFESLIALYESEREANIGLRSRLAASEASNETCRKQITELERQVENLKLAEAFLTPTGSSDSAKERIDRLIKEIDKCISLLEK